VYPTAEEGCLIAYPAVAASAMIGKPDAERTEVVKAFVALRSGYAPTPELASELQQFVKQGQVAHAYGREVEVASALPKTPSGKTAIYSSPGGDGTSERARRVLRRSG
jgi:acetyl-CoA synthetase